MAEENERTFSGNVIPKRSFDFFQDMWNKKELCDFTFQVGEESLSVHRIIVTAVIPYFRNIWASDLAQRDEDFNMPDSIEPSAFKSLIKYAYSYEIKIDKRNVKNLLAAACFFGVDEVIEECCDFIGDILDIENVMDFREFAQNLNCRELMKTTDFYFTEHFEEISQTTDFLKLPLTYLKDLISKDDLNVDSEEQVFEATLKWVKYSPIERSVELPELLRAVRMPLLEPLYLKKVIENEKLLKRSAMCRYLLEEAKNCQLYPQLRISTCSFSTKPRQFMKTACVTHNNNNNNECFYQFFYHIQFKLQSLNFEMQKWDDIVDERYRGDSDPFVEFQNIMYYFGSIFSIKFNPMAKTYSYLHGMPTARSFASASVLKNKIFVCGGCAKWKPSNIVECYDPEEDKWTRVRDMHTARDGLSVVTVGEYIFALGGESSSVERYDPETNRWRIMSSMLTDRSDAGAATLNGKIYICGGTTVETFESRVDGVATAEVYEPVKNRWEFISSMNAPRNIFSLLSYHGQLYAFGGRFGEGYLEIYDPESNEWRWGPITDRIDEDASAAVVMCAPSPHGMASQSACRVNQSGHPDNPQFGPESLR